MPYLWHFVAAVQSVTEEVLFLRKDSKTPPYITNSEWLLVLNIYPLSQPTNGLLQPVGSKASTLTRACTCIGKGNKSG